MYSRADFSRTVVLVVALSLTAAATGVFAREFCVADTRNDRTDVSLIGDIAPSMNVLATPPLFRSIENAKMWAGSVGADPVELPYGQVLVRLATTQRDPAPAQPTERIRKVE